MRCGCSMYMIRGLHSVVFLIVYRLKFQATLALKLKRMPSAIRTSKRWKVVDTNGDRSYWDNLVGPDKEASSAQLVAGEGGALRGEIVFRKPKRCWQFYRDDRPTATLIHPQRPTRRRITKKRPEGEIDSASATAPGPHCVATTSPAPPSTANEYQAAAVQPTCLGVHGEYELLPECLGRGSFGSVFAGSRRSDKREVAMKFSTGSNALSDLCHEMRYMDAAKGPHIVKLIAAHASYETCQGVLVMERALGTLHRVLVPRDHIHGGDDPVKRIETAYMSSLDALLHLFSAAAHLYGRAIVHRDVKPHNILCFLEDRPQAASGARQG